MIKGVIFDMDGVIIDSNHIIFENWSVIFKKKFNKIIDKKEFAMHLGESAKHFLEFFVEKFELNVSNENLLLELKNNYRQNLEHKIILKKSVIKTLKMLKENNYKTALATGANKDTALRVIKKFEIEKYFDYIIGGDEVKRAKPNPEIFLKAAQGLKLKPNECIVIEDAKKGIIAANSANIKVISIPDDITKYQDHSIADFHLKSMNELNFEFIMSIIQHKKSKNS
ncbi:HAD-IA family hydrolase [archaeon]|jgi:beta-phosphoglucomutase|nr:HAD-IA family hydrolase [archaeon]MBT4351750.1 HAD-IA family hydrolase [archaeon]MBT4647855.1 HAD-IA family hydrolase [archaeon]MBT6821056.1 HAD-IA family hydrolase [archaeon]MBT7392025.1 HAD-IA family hydrolase [archaeon]